MLRHWIPFLESLHTSPLIGDHSSHPPFGLCCALSWELFMLQLHLLHPQSIVLIVERFYRQLKVSLRARLASSDWFHHLPLVLLELCNVPTDNSPVSAAEVLFGTLLALPGVSQQPPGSFWRILVYLPHHSVLNPDSGAESKIPTRLLTCSHVFVREDAAEPPLALQYRGPYLVLKCSSKFFSPQVGSKTDSVSVDWLKQVLSELSLVSQDPPCWVRPQNPRPPALAFVCSAPHIKSKKNSSLIPCPPSRFSSLPTRRNPRKAVWNKPHPHQQDQGWCWGDPCRRLTFLSSNLSSLEDPN